MEEIYVVVGLGPDGVEGVATWINPATRMMEPLIGSKEKLEQLTAAAKAGAREAKIPLRMLKFTSAEEVEAFPPPEELTN
jgi:hypothetical protein